MRKDMVADSPKIRVLVVEDTEDSRILMEHILKNEGFAVELAVDGAQAIAKATTGNFDVILMDHEMPVKDGIQATKELRASGYDRPIIALTAHTVRERENIYTQAGFNGCVSKPVDFKELFRIIRARSGT